MGPGRLGLSGTRRPVQRWLCPGDGYGTSFGSVRYPCTEGEIHMLKFIGGTVGIIFIIGLLVVIGILSLIF